jgi:hypothetical protein
MVSIQQLAKQLERPLPEVKDLCKKLFGSVFSELTDEQVALIHNEQNTTATPLQLESVILKEDLVDKLIDSDETTFQDKVDASIQRRLAYYSSAKYRLAVEMVGNCAAIDSEFTRKPKPVPIIEANEYAAIRKALGMAVSNSTHPQLPGAN